MEGDWPEENTVKLDERSSGVRCARRIFVSATPPRLTDTVRGSGGGYALGWRGGIGDMCAEYRGLNAYGVSGNVWRFAVTGTRDSMLELRRGAGSSFDATARGAGTVPLRPRPEGPRTRVDRVTGNMKSSKSGDSVGVSPESRAVTGTDGAPACVRKRRSVSEGERDDIGE